MGFSFFGDVFSPALLVGAAAGSIATSVLSWMGIQSFQGSEVIICGMAAVAGSVIGAPISMIMIVLELTSSYSLAVASTIGIVTAKMISGQLFEHSIFDKQLLSRGIDLSQGRMIIRLMEENITTHPRRKAREVTMQALYALEINNGYPQDVLELCDDSFNNSENDIYTRELFNCVVEKQSWADDLISQCLENWEYGRVAILDKILLRMGVSEIYHIDDVPPKVSISEMVEIAKVYSTEESSSFVNGILDTIYKNYSEKN